MCRVGLFGKPMIQPAPARVSRPFTAFPALRGIAESRIRRNPLAPLCFRVAMRRVAVSRIACSLLVLASCAKAPSTARPSPLAAFVDQYLDGFASRHPSIAAGNGLHQHDDRMEDFSRAAI